LLSRLLILSAFYVSMVFSQDKGLNYYQNQEFEAAQDYYESVLREKGNQSQAQFGRGSSAFQQGDMETAKQAFEQSLKSSDVKLKSKAMYNLGNTFYQEEKKEEAMAFYRKALELDPNDKEAKFNYEFLKYQENPPEDQQQQDQEKNDENDEKKDQEKQDQKDQQDKKDNKEKQDQEDKQQDEQEEEKKEDEKKEQEDQKEKEEQEQQKQQQQQEAAEEEKSQDLKQAESILDALKQDEKIMQKRQIARAKSRKLAKDW